MTGTYGDDYGYSHGLTLVRNVHKDFSRYLDKTPLMDFAAGSSFCLGVEQHRWRDILHWHGLIRGPFEPEQLEILKALWRVDRGFCRIVETGDLAVVEYVTKYALKGDTDNFEFRLQKCSP